MSILQMLGIAVELGCLELKALRSLGRYCNSLCIILSSLLLSSGALRSLSGELQ